MRAARCVVLSDRGVVHAEIAADRANDHLAGVEPDTNLNRDPAGALQIVPVAADALLHAEGGIARSYRVVLMGNGRSEQCHDPVAHDLIDRALIAMDRFHHVLENRVEHPTGFLGVTVGQQLHRAFEIGKKHGDMLALALERTSGGENLLGEVPRGVAVWSANFYLRGEWARAVEQLATFSTKFLPGWIDSAAALSTDQGEPASAVPAKLLSHGILTTAPGALHGGEPSWPS
jgi:hypothetical protein